MKRVLCFLLLVAIFPFLTETSMAQEALRSKLLGVWAMEKMEIITTRALTPLQAKKVAATRRKLAKSNRDIAADSLLLRVEFKSDSTYAYKQTFARQVQYFERGTWQLHDSIMEATNLTHNNERSSFDGEKTVELTNERWVVEFTVFGKFSGIIERISYKRKQQH